MGNLMRLIMAVVDLAKAYAARRRAMRDLERTIMRVARATINSEDRKGGE